MQGYLSDGTIFDATHAEGKKSVLMFELGGNAVVPGVSEMVGEMGVGQKVQAIVSKRIIWSCNVRETGKLILFFGTPNRSHRNWPLETRDFAWKLENA